jgi:hypothetical protein
VFVRLGLPAIRCPAWETSTGQVASAYLEVVAMCAAFTVFFDGRFWAGVLEIHAADGVHSTRRVSSCDTTTQAAGWGALGV